MYYSTVQTHPCHFNNLRFWSFAVSSSQVHQLFQRHCVSLTSQSFTLLLTWRLSAIEIPLSNKQGRSSTPSDVMYKTSMHLFVIWHTNKAVKEAAFPHCTKHHKNHKDDLRRFLWFHIAAVQTHNVNCCVIWAHKMSDLYGWIQNSVQSQLARNNKKS